MMKERKTLSWIFYAELFTVLLCFCVRVCDVQAQETTPDVPDSVFYRNSRPIIFRVNRTEVKKEDREWMTDSLLPALNALGPNGYILARSAASPEGPTPNNQRLARGRRDAANNVLRSLGFDAERLQYKVITEDYPLLLVMMSIRQDVDYPLVDGMAKECKGNFPVLKKKLMSYNGGKLWKRLLREYYPELRATRIMLVDKRVFNPIVGDEVLPAIAMLPLTTVEMAFEAEIKPMNVTYDPLPFTLINEPVHRIPLLNLRSNLLYDGFYMPRFGWAPMLNIGVEFYPRFGHFTYNAWFMGPYYHKWKKHKFFQIRDYELEVRYYFRGTDRADYHGWFVSLALDNNIYGIGLGKRDGWEGEGLGGQVNVGYVLPIARHKQWKLQFVVGAGYYHTWYDPYLYGIPDPFGHYEDGLYYYDTNLYRQDFKKRQHRFSWFGPTQVAINLSYDLLWRKGTNQKLPAGGGKVRGISFKRWEISPKYLRKQQEAVEAIEASQLKPSAPTRPLQAIEPVAIAQPTMPSMTQQPDEPLIVPSSSPKGEDASLVEAGEK